MAYSIVFKFPDTTTFDASSILENRLEIRETLHNEKFENSKNSASFDTVFDSTLLSKIEAASGFVSVEIKDGSTWLFNGILQPLTDLSISNAKNSFTFEVWDRACLLEYNLTTSKFYNDKSVQYIVNDLLTSSGVSISSWPARAGTTTIKRGAFKTDKTIWEIINQLFFEFGFSLSFNPDGTALITDLMVNVTSTLTLDDSTNLGIIDGSYKLAKRNTKGKSEKVSIQASYVNVYSIPHSPFVFNSGWNDSDKIRFSTFVTANESKYFPGVAHWISGGVAPICDNLTVNFGAPKTQDKYLGIDGVTIKITAYAGVGYGDPFPDTYYGLHSFYDFTISGGVVTSAVRRERRLDWNPQTYQTTSLAPTDYSMTVTVYNDKAVIDLRITNNAKLQSYSGSRQYRGVLIWSFKVDGTAYLGETVDPQKITNAKSTVENYSLEFAQNISQVTDFLNLKSDIANNRNWKSKFRSYNGYALGTGTTVNMTRQGVSQTGVIFEKQTTYQRGFVEYDYSLVSYSTISITTPASYPDVVVEVPPPPVANIDGNLLTPIQVQLLPQADTSTLTTNDIILDRLGLGFWDVAASDYRARLAADGAFRLGLTSGKNLQYDPTTGNLTLTGDVVAAGGTIAGWEILSDLLRSAGSGARIELNKTKSRISIFDGSGVEVVAMGYIDGLTDPVSGSPIAAGQYGFWAKNGNTINFKSNIVFEATTTANGAYNRGSGEIVPVGTIIEWVGASFPPGYLSCDGGSVSRSTYPALFSALTRFIGSSWTFSGTLITTSTFHGLTTGDRIFFTNSGSPALASPLIADTPYCVRVVSSTTFTVHYSNGQALNNLQPVTLTGTSPQTGNSITYAPWGVTGSTTFLLPDFRESSTVGIGKRDKIGVVSLGCTLSIATPAVMTVPSSSLTIPCLDIGSAVSFSTSGSLPTGLSVGVVYYVTPISHIDYKLSTTLANCLAGVYINTSGTQSGAHTIDGSTDKITTLGDFKNDQIQGHIHQTSSTLRALTSSATGGSSTVSTALTSSAVVTIGSPTDDGINGVVRTGLTTHGKIVGIRKLIKYD